MTMIKAIEPQEWATFLGAFTERNHGRRARFELFEREGNFSEEVQEGDFKSAAINGSTVTIVRHYSNHGEQKTMTDEIEDIRGIAVQYDTDNSEDMLEFTSANNTLTTLHFESRVDGDS